MRTEPEPGERLFEQVIADAHLALPEQLGDLLDRHAPTIDGREARLYLVDYEQQHLVPVPVEGCAPLPSATVATTVPGRCFALLDPVVVDTDGGQRLWVPLVDGLERLGVVGITFDEVDELTVERTRRLAGLFAEFVATKTRFGDVLELLRRSRPMSLAAEMLWRTLPPLTMGSRSVVISAQLEPCYDVGGDAFDYALNGSTAHIALFDGMGHGLQAGLLAAVGSAAYRASRRTGLDLSETADAIDAAVATQFGSDRFLTGILAELDTRTGHISWVSAGHPEPLVVRGRRVVKSLSADSGPPLGTSLGGWSVDTEQLEPGDRVLLYTDGVVEARSAAGEFFGVERLSEFVAREAATELPAPEVLRRLVLAVLGHQEGRLQDDATALVVEWSGLAAEDLLP